MLYNSEFPILEFDPAPRANLIELALKLVQSL